MIPSGWVAERNDSGNRVSYTGEFPAATSTTVFTIPVVAEVTNSDINRLIRIEAVNLDTDTPAESKVSFTGTANTGEVLSFRNAFSLGSVAAGIYDITAAVGINNGNVELYPTAYVRLNDDNVRVVTPVISPRNVTFTDYIDVTITCETEDAVIYYTLDGKNPDINSHKYTHTIRLTDDAFVKAVAYSMGMKRSNVASSVFMLNKRPPVSATECISPFDFSDENGLTQMGIDIQESGNTEVAGRNISVGEITLILNKSFGAESPSLVNEEDGLSLQLAPGNQMTFIPDTDSDYAYSIRDITFLGRNISGILYRNLPLTSDRWYSDDEDGTRTPVVFDIDSNVELEIIEVSYLKTEESGSSSDIEILETENAQPIVKYYNMAGLEIHNPVSGIYIRECSGRRDKIVVK
ncbi:MAG: chitobiase/beta-hexosaminidase C-terminal domain-containing protein [Muribaculaceae bacterium]|nr:chitobiase/beta-hexosaminidase C-terminal domain-containing protein [Muribaculaceae bacterium]